MLRRRVWEVERQVARQREIVAKLQGAGMPTDLAEAMLQSLLENLSLHRLHLERTELSLH
jgi:RimJ/RimL family protein N-acetyltransferase